MAKRTRSDSSLAQRKAIAIARKMRARFPYADYGTAHYRRGTAENIERFGETYKAGSPQQRMLRKVTGYVGRGKYSVGKFSKDFKALVPKSIRRAAEEQIASSMVGRGLYSGRGAYDANVLVSGGRDSMQFSSANDETQSITISHCEYLQDIFGAANAGFNVESWKLNPGLIENFPWLAQLAANYEEYEFVQLLFHYKSTVDPSATNNSSGATGTLIMATNYNSTAPNFTSKEVMMQYHGANSGRVTDDHTHGVECAPDKNAGSAQKYVRTTPVVVGQDPKTFDLGTFQLAQVNIPSAFFNQQIGELWVTYTVKLSKPRLFSALACTVLENRWVSNGGETNTNVFGSSTALLSMQQNALPIALSFPASSQYTLSFPDFLTGVYEVQFLVEAAAGFGTVTASVALGGNVVQWNDLYATGSPSSDAPSNSVIAGGGAGNNSTNIVYLGRFSIAPVTGAIDNTVTITLSIASGTVTQAQLIVRQCNPVLGQSPGTAVPYYVNSSGTVVNPAP